MDESSYLCSLCDKTFKKNFRLRRHMYKEHIKPTCTACNASFGRMKELKEHATQVHELKMNKLCSICKKAYHSRRELEDHLKEEHTKEGPLICNKCPRMFTTEERLKAHIQTHKRSGEFQCDDCTTTFSASFKLARHRRTFHGGVKTLHCPECGEEFEADEELRKMICKLHFDSKPVSRGKQHPCKYCDQDFVKSRDMNLHIRAQHADLRPHKCEKCNFIFETSEELEKHGVRHTTEVTCEICQRKFWQEYALLKHTRFNHGKRNAKKSEGEDVQNGTHENGLLNGSDRDIISDQEASEVKKEEI